MYMIVGANGFFGAYIMQAVLELTQDSILALGRNVGDAQTVDAGSADKDSRIRWMQCDITKKEDIDRVQDTLAQKEDLKVIFLAAYHNPDLVEKHKHTAWNTNITALSIFMNTISNVKCFFYPSSDSVYGNGGTSRHFKETDRLNPVNRYGVQKAAAEYLVNAYGYNVVRFPFLIGPSLVMHKKHFYDQIVQSIEEGRRMQMFTDSVRSSLDFQTAARLLVQLMEQYHPDMPKILNVSGDEDLSKYDVGIRIARKLGAEESWIEPISTENTKGIFEAKRAASTLLDNQEMKKYLGLTEVKMQI